MPHRKDEGNFEFSEEETATARAAMLLAIFFRNEVAEEALVQTVTGVPLSRIIELMNELDELTGHNNEVRQFISEQLQRLTLLPDAELIRQHSQAEELMNAAERYHIDVPPDILRRINLFE
jgi:hypothetical protein